MKKTDHHEITHEGELLINNLSIPCYVLVDGTRIISGNQMQEALKLFPDDARVKSGSRLARLLSYQGVKDLIFNKYDAGRFEPIICYKGNSKINGYEATVLVDICEVMLEARKLGRLTTERQKTIATQAETLIRSFARVGIIALIDEATGYQEVREKDALKSFLEKFLQEEKTKYIRTFPDEFFEMIFKMKGLSWVKANKGKKPQWVGHHINDFVYSRLGPEVLYSLRKLNPKNEKGNRSGKHFQYTTEDTGLPKLKEHINILIALGKASGYNWINFKRLVERALPPYSQDGSRLQELPFTDIEIIE